MTIIIAVLCLLASSSAIGVDKAAGEHKIGQPNVVILFADDLGYGDLGSYGHPYIRTPNLDEMAREGQRWTDFYAAAPVCSPSRAALLTGRYPVRTGQFGARMGVYFPNEAGGFPAEETTIAELLSAAGYRTGMFGKWHLGDAPHALPTRHGFDEWLGIPYSNDMDWEVGPDIDGMMRLSQAGKTDEVRRIYASRRALYANPVAGAWQVPLIRSVREGTSFQDTVVEQPADQSLITQRYTREAIRFIEQSGEAPFFVYLPYTMPHTPLFRSPSFEGHSLGGRYGDVIEEIDWSVGQIRAALRQSGQLENTLILFTSDMGPWLSMLTEGGRAGLLRMGQGTTFEGGMRVPGIFSWPGHIKPGVVSEVGSTLDFYRTIAAITGLDGSAGVDGYDLSSTLFERKPSARKALAYYRGGALYAYRSGPWKLHLRTQGAYGQGPELTVHEKPVLHHLHDDPSERFDVSEANEATIGALMAEISTHHAQMNVQPPAMDARLALIPPAKESARIPRRCRKLPDGLIDFCANIVKLIFAG